MYIKKGARILLVEDEQALRAIMAEELRDMGYDVTEADGVVSAVAALQDDFDLLLTDIRMGKVSGWDLAEAARRMQPTIEVIYMTGYSDEKPRRVDRSIFLMKPFTVDQIMSIVSTCCTGAPGAQALC